MDLIEKSNSLQFHYYFRDDSHSIDSILRNECEKEITHKSATKICFIWNFSVKAYQQFVNFILLSQAING